MAAATEWLLVALFLSFKALSWLNYAYIEYYTGLARRFRCRLASSLEAAYANSDANKHAEDIEARLNVAFLDMLVLNWIIDLVASAVLMSFPIFLLSAFAEPLIAEAGLAFGRRTTAWIRDRDIELAEVEIIRHTGGSLSSRLLPGLSWAVKLKYVAQEDAPVSRRYLVSLMRATPYLYMAVASALFILYL